jgi:nickel/cobalt exporter
MLANALPMIMAGFSLGLIHALDADHVMAVSALSSQKPGLLRTLKHSAHWAVGHASILLVSGLLLFGLGWKIPQEFIHVAEASVGLVLIIIGAFCFYKIKQQPLQLSHHQHGDVVHTHWCINEELTTHVQKKGEGHTPVLVGMLHGLAGSAPALALIPVVVQGDVYSAFMYLMMFSVGVLLSMLLFATGLGAMQKKLKRINIRIYQFSRYLIASLSILLGGFWLTQSL